jgi:multidrug efflux pump subunit AcrA (membrane-fusion protein)
MNQPTFVLYKRLVREKVLKADASPIGIGFQDGQGFPHAGTITGFDDHFEDGKIYVRGSIANPNKELLPGMEIKVHVALGKPRPVLLVPETAICARDGQCFVKVLTEKQGIEERKIGVGTFYDGMYEVEEGLRAEDWVFKHFDKTPQ